MKNNKKFWDNILNSKKLLSDKEAEDIEKIIKDGRKEIGFRDETSY